MIHNHLKVKIHLIHNPHELHLQSTLIFSKIRTRHLFNPRSPFLPSTLAFSTIHTHLIYHPHSPSLQSTLTFFTIKFIVFEWTVHFTVAHLAPNAIKYGGKVHFSSVFSSFFYYKVTYFSMHFPSALHWNWSNGSHADTSPVSRKYILKFHTF